MFIRPMRPEDNKDVYNACLTTDILDQNTSYMYKILPLFHPDYCWVAEDDGKLIGYIVGFQTQAEEAFVWQLFVHEDYKRRGIASQMLDMLVKRTNAQHLIATVEINNEASHASFRSLARRHDAHCHVEPIFTSDDWVEDWNGENLVTVSFTTPSAVRYRSSFLKS